MGVVILEMVHNTPPFMSSLPSYFGKIYANEGPEIPPFLSENIKKILSMCLTFDVAKRPYTKDIMEFVHKVYVPEPER